MDLLKMGLLVSTGDLSALDRLIDGLVPTIATG